MGYKRAIGVYAFLRFEFKGMGMYSSIGRRCVGWLIYEWLYFGVFMPCMGIFHFFFFLRGVFWFRLIVTLKLYSPNMLDVIVLGICGLHGGGL